ncbi:hypothetical protein B0A52_09471 [Exophiala mesophila]|uniref:Zinc-regulated transporter 2 n=1 Tax=Exophiala mesophila TaxID=212818 RepID=A0A438MSF0_EXOME|nr:hypothetical protein B0A52_09471 [Exophiala mesophila]
MNCPSRVDETVLHPDWNQNPPFLAPDLTTRQDLDGIANAREHKYGELGSGNDLDGSGDGFLPQFYDHSEKIDLPSSPRREGSPLKDFGTSFKGQLTPRLKLTNLGLEPCLQSKPTLSCSLGSGLFLTLINGGMLCAHYGLFSKPANHTFEDPFVASSETYRLKKRDACRDGSEEDTYNLPLHIGAVFIVLFVSGSACAFPLLALKVPRLRIPSIFLFAARHFGTGVLIATAFVHLLPTAFIMLGNECLGDFWTSDYDAMPGAIALAAVFFVTIIEMVFTPVRSCYPSSSPASATNLENTTQSPENALAGSSPEPRVNSPRDNEVPMRNLGLLKGRSSSVGQRVSRLAENSEITELSERDQLQQVSNKTNPDFSGKENSDVLKIPVHFEIELTPEQKQRKAVMQCVLLEVGILFHSVFIGMALSVSTGSDFVVLLIAIVFHQTFEGLALGSRIADIKWENKAVQPWLMALAYGCTTPVGQALGLGLHTLYHPESKTGLLLVGIMNAISAGLLVYASLVELLSEDFLSDASWRVLRGRRRVYACLLVFFGAFGMSVIGAWA